MYIIWNLTDICPWDCVFCCMSAKNKGNINSDKKVLSHTKKMEILRILATKDVKIDFSGGDPLFYPEDFLMIEEATRLLSKEKIDVSMTGCDFNAKKLKLIKNVGKVEISIDNVPGEVNQFRPTGFNYSAIKTLKVLVREGIFCSAVTTLYPNTIKEKRLKKLYELLCRVGVPQWNILRFYPVGRGASLSGLNIAEKKLLEIMDFLDSLSGSTEIVFQHSLRLLRGEYQCHAAVKSIGILPDGTVVACGWALDKNSHPLSGFKLGQLPDDDFDDMLKRAREEMGYEERKKICRIMTHLRKRGDI
jgi:MoaA/NifB/PqqE/SkfB family radical SAM enzyme